MKTEYIAGTLPNKVSSGPIRKRAEYHSGAANVGTSGPSLFMQLAV